MNHEPAKGQSSSFPFIPPKEEEMDEEEFDRMMEARYGPASKFIRFAGDEFDDKIFDPNSLHADVKESLPTIWKVKCTVCYLKHGFSDLLMEILSFTFKRS